ncbi:MAG: four helix bundle protein [Bacteroidales bacterium]|jgi:four helix bundle protein|nr:four helix bundle protein [Bacteroidales bacterium]
MGKCLLEKDSNLISQGKGLGRYHYKERKNFSYYSRGSLFETKTWLNKAVNRKLINQEKYKVLLQNTEVIGIKINNYINSIRSKQ